MKSGPFQDIHREWGLPGGLRTHGEGLEVEVVWQLEALILEKYKES